MARPAGPPPTTRTSIGPIVPCHDSRQRGYRCVLRARPPLRRPLRRRLGQCPARVLRVDVLAVHRRSRLLTPRFGDRAGSDRIESERFDIAVDQFAARSVLAGDGECDAVRCSAGLTALEQMLPPDSVEYLVHRPADLLRRPRTFDLAVLD